METTIADIARYLGVAQQVQAERLGTLEVKVTTGKSFGTKSVYLAIRVTDPIKWEELGFWRLDTRYNAENNEKEFKDFLAKMKEVSV